MILKTKHSKKKFKWMNSLWLLDQCLMLQTVRDSSRYLDYKSILSSGRMSEKYQPIFQNVRSYPEFSVGWKQKFHVKWEKSRAKTMVFFFFFLAFPVQLDLMWLTVNIIHELLHVLWLPTISRAYSRNVTFTQTPKFSFPSDKGRLCSQQFDNRGVFLFVKQQGRRPCDSQEEGQEKPPWSLLDSVNTRDNQIKVHLRSWPLLLSQAWCCLCKPLGWNSMSLT